MRDLKLPIPTNKREYLMKNTEELREFRRRIGNNIRKIRIERNQTLQNLSKHCTISVFRLDDFEMGKRNIHLDVAALISKGLKVPMGRLFE